MQNSIIRDNLSYTGDKVLIGNRPTGTQSRLLKVIGILFIVIPFLSFATITENYTIIKGIMNGWRIISFVVVLFQLMCRRFRVSMYIKLEIVWGLLYILSTVMNHGVIVSSFSRIMAIVGLSIYSEHYLKRNPSLYISVVSKLFAAILCVDSIQAICIFYNSNILSSILGSDNFAIFMIIPMIGTILLYCHQKGKSNNTPFYIVIVLAVLAKLYTRAITSIIAFAVMFIIYFHNSRVKYLRKIRRMLPIGLIIIFVACFVVFREHIFGFINNFAISIGKHSTTGVLGWDRPAIWIKSIEAITKKPLMGYGAMTEDMETQVIYGSIGWMAKPFSHTHNMLLEMLLETGIVGTALFLSMIFIVISSISRIEEKKTRRIINATLLAYLIISLTDSYFALTTIYFFMLLVLAISNKGASAMKDIYASKNRLFADV